MAVCRTRIKYQCSNSVPNSSSMSFTPFTPFLFISIFLSNLVNARVIKPITQETFSPHIFTVDVVNQFPHDPNAWTQGLLYWKNGTLYESTGRYYQSTVRRVALQTGKVEAQYKMDDSLFGEGLTLIDEKLYQVTYLRNIGYIYDRESLSKIASFTHQMNDGWGLATDGNILFGTDGSSTLYQMDPETMEVIQKQTIRYEGLDVYNLNELEYINGEVWANIWKTDCIVRISPRDGTVVGWILLHNLREGLIASGETGLDVLNGIAWDSSTNRIFVTGKLWPKLFEIKLKPVNERSRVNIQQSCIPRLFNF